MKGKWLGYYMYDNASVQSAIGFNRTEFHVAIDYFDGKEFKGSVEDNIKQGGTVGTGTIQGVKENNSIRFEKHMPVRTFLGKDGKPMSMIGKHPVIYYEGTITEHGNRITGTWKIKFGFIWIGILPIPSLRTTGKWIMEKLK